jgi:hypothetical protein
MVEKAAGNQAKTVVVPRGLEGFFRERLERRYEGHDNVRVIVDRRHRERRRPVDAAPGRGVADERRRADRRDRHASWSLPDMPFANS